MIKKFVLRAKTNLRNTIKYKKVYMRGTQTHAERLNELNFKATLHKISGGNRYRITGSGRLVYKDQGEARDTAMTQDGEDAGEGGRDAGARQRGGRGGQIGRGRGGRGGHGLRDFRGQDRNAAHFSWDDKARDSNCGSYRPQRDRDMTGGHRRTASADARHDDGDYGAGGGH